MLAPQLMEKAQQAYAAISGDITCGTCPLALLWLRQSAKFYDIEVFLFLFEKMKQT